MKELAAPAPPTLRLAEIVRFDSPTSMAFAERIGAELSGHSIGCRIHGYDAEPMPAANGGHLVLVFPIRGDERMPDQVEAWIRSVPGGTTHSLWVTGDFRTGEPCDRVAADEATRLLSERGSLPLVPPMLVDTPVDAADVSRLVGEWAARLLSPVIELSPPLEAGAPERTSLDDMAEEPLRRIVARLPAVPEVVLDTEGRCVSLTLTDGAPYVRGLLAGLPAGEVRAVLDLVGELRRLERLGVPYSGLTTVDLDLPPSVTTVDVRGNRVTNLEFLRGAEAVAFLNLADCDLAEVPEVLATLPRLHTLVLGKNRITSIPGWCSELRSLRRFSTYRNMLTEVPGLSHLPRLELLNVGASPLPLGADDLSDLPALELLGLRLIGLEEVPPTMWQLPALRQVDLSKNPLPPVTTNGERFRFVDRLPSWAWDEPADERNGSEGLSR